MRSSRSTAALFIVIICLVGICCVPTVSALAVSKVNIDPAGAIPSGTPVNVSAQIDFHVSSGETFPSPNELQIATDLDHPQWEYSLVLDGTEKSQPHSSGRLLAISGWVLSYPAEVKESLVLHMQGTAPAVPQAANKTIIQIQEIDSHNNCNCMGSPAFTRTALVFNTTYLSETIQRQQSGLSQFRVHIDEKAAKGVNTTPAEEKYLLARSYLNKLSRTPADYSDWQHNLTLSDTAITEGETLLDKAWAEKTVADAEIQITKANDKIDAIHANLSRPFDERLTQSYVNRDLATADIALAKDNISQGDFPQARIHANAAYDEANASYYEALDTQKRMAGPLNPVPVSVAVPVFALLGVACILRWRNRG